MKQRNVDIVRRIYESFADGDMEGFLAVLDEDLVMHETEGVVGGGTFTGKGEFVETIESMASLWDDVTAVPERFIADGDTVVAEIIWSATAKETGRSVSLPGVHVFDLEDGKVAEWTSYIDSARFNEALGD